MEDNDFYNPHAAKMFFEAMMYNGGFRLDLHCGRDPSYSPDLSPIRKRSISPIECRKREVDILPSERFRGKKVNYSELADKNAQQLIEEEEQAKIKKEKKRAKKERQKLKKMKIKENDSFDYPINTISSDMDKLALNSDNKETEGLDIQAAFMSKAVKKVKHIIIPENQPIKEGNNIHYFIKMASEYQNQEYFKEALQYYSEAIKLAPKRFDLFLKRSLIYYQLSKFDKSIHDAQKVLQYSPNNSEAYYRIGEAHYALNNIVEAEDVFNKLIRTNVYCEESKKRLFSIRVNQLEDMGYHPNEAYTALLKSKKQTLDEAIEYLTALENGKICNEDLYYSDEDESDEEEDEEIGKGATGPLISKNKSSIVVQNNHKVLTDSSNPLKCASLFVGNLKKGITYDEIHNVFVQFGGIRTIKLTTKPNCFAFVNYLESISAGSAMEALQDSKWLLSTVPLLIKYPTNVVNNIVSNLENPLEILNKYIHSSYQPKEAAQKLQIKNKSTIIYPGATDKPWLPPSADECYYWRTSGCTYGKSCINLHIPESQGIDQRFH